MNNIIKKTLKDYGYKEGIDYHFTGQGELVPYDEDKAQAMADCLQSICIGEMWCSYLESDNRIYVGGYNI